MKTLIQFIGVLPLLGLTAWSLAELRDPESVQFTPSTVDVAQEEQSCERTEQWVRKELPLARQLAAGDVLTAKPLALDDPGDDVLRATVQAWRQAEGARDLAGAVSAAKTKADRDAELTDSPRAKIAAEVHDWQEFLAAGRSRTIGKVAGADDAFGAIERYCAKLGAQEGRLSAEENVERALVHAAELLDSRQLDTTVKGASDGGGDQKNGGGNRAKVAECLASLKEKPLRSVRDARQLERIDVLRRRARYHLDWYDVFTSPAPPARAQLVRIEEFLGKHPQPPTPAENKADATARKRLLTAQVDVALPGLAAAGDLRALLSRADAIAHLLSRADEIPIEKAATEAQRQTVRESARRWPLAKGLPKIDVPKDLRLLREAIVKPANPSPTPTTTQGSGQRKIGDFALTDAVRPWRYWSRSGLREDIPEGESRIARDQFVVDPETPHYVKWADEYERQRLKLARADAKRDDWTAAGKRLAAMQDELSKYRAQWGGADRWDRACGAWTFEPPLVTIRQMLESWDRYRALVRADDRE